MQIVFAADWVWLTLFCYALCRMMLH